MATQSPASLFHIPTWCHGVGHAAHGDVTAYLLLQGALVGMALCWGSVGRAEWHGRLKPSVVGRLEALPWCWPPGEQANILWGCGVR